MSKPENKTAVLLSSEICDGIAANTGIHLATQFGAMRPDVAGPPVQDASRVRHSGLPIWPNVVLSISPADLRRVIHRARQISEGGDLMVLDYPEQGFTTSTNEEYRREVAEVGEECISYLGCLVFGPRRQVDKAMKNTRTSLWNGSPGNTVCQTT